MRPGSKVIIRHNPHHAGAEDIIGEVVAYRRGEGFFGCDIVDVRYTDPKTGEEHTMPFGLSCLGPADQATLLALAECHEALAANLRKLAGESNLQ